MRSGKILLFFITIILPTLACMVGGLPQPTQPVIPIVTQTIAPRPTRTTAPTLVQEYPKETPAPVWVTEFADPILAAVANRKPVFQDDFSIYRGWRSVMSEVEGYVTAERMDGMLFLRLPERTEDSFVYNPKLNRTNFVLTLDLRFSHNLPEDTVRFQFDQSPDQSITLDLTNNNKWRFQWGAQDNLQSMSGVFKQFPPEHLPVTFIMRDSECAVFLNDDPLVYSRNCRTSQISQSQEWTVAFRLLRDSSRAVVVNFDNLKLWDLDKIPGLP